MKKNLTVEAMRDAPPPPVQENLIPAFLQIDAERRKASWNEYRAAKKKEKKL